MAELLKQSEHCNRDNKEKALTTTLLALINFEGIAIQPVLIGGELYWIATEICRALGITNTSQAVENLDDDEKLLYLLHIAGQNRQVICVNESGLYHLIFQSRKPEAQRFRKWVTGEVLPTIRKTGNYSISSAATVEDRLQRIEQDIETLKQVKQQASHTHTRRVGTSANKPPEIIEAPSNKRPLEEKIICVARRLRDRNQPAPSQRTFAAYLNMKPRDILPLLQTLAVRGVFRQTPGRQFRSFKFELIEGPEDRG